MPDKEIALALIMAVLVFVFAGLMCFALAVLVSFANM